jgi:hypothetical protein
VTAADRLRLDAERDAAIRAPYDPWRGRGGPLERFALPPAAVRWLLDPRAPSTLAVNGGIGCGKSWLLAYMLGVVASTRPGSASALLSDSWPSLAGNNLPPCLALFEGRGEWHPSERMFRFGNGSTIELRHYHVTSGALESQNPIEGRNYSGLIVCDEAQKLSPMVLDHALSRARGQVVDLTGQVWAPRVVMNGRPDAGLWWWEVAVEEMGGRVMKPRTVENPHNGPDYLRNLALRYSPAMFRCVTEGVPAPAEGGVFEDFVEAAPPAGNVIEGWRFDPAAPVHLGVDFGRRTPAVVWVQPSTVLGEPVDVVFDEVAPDECTTPQLIARILAPWRNRWPDVSQVYGACRDTCDTWPVSVAYVDPAGNARNVQTGASEVALLRRPAGESVDALGGGLGCRVVTTTDAAKVSVSAGLLRLQALVNPAQGARRLLVTRELWDRGIAAPSTMRTLPRALMRFTWGMVDRKAAGRTEDPATHHVDALRYWAIGARWGGPAPAMVSTGVSLGKR